MTRPTLRFGAVCGRSACRRLRPRLAELAAAWSDSRRLPGGSGARSRAPDAGSSVDELAAAGRHLETCHTCRREAEQLALVALAVRRTWVGMSDEPAPEAWTRLRARVTGRPVGPGWPASPLLGLVLGTALVLGFTLPSGSRLPTGDSPPVLAETGQAVGEGAPWRSDDEWLEGEWLFRQARDLSAARPAAVLVQLPAEHGGGAFGSAIPPRAQMRYAEADLPTRTGPPSVPPPVIL